MKNVVVSLALLASLASVAKAKDMTLCQSVMSQMDLRDGSGNEIDVSYLENGKLDHFAFGGAGYDEVNTPFDGSNYKQLIKVRNSKHQKLYTLEAHYDADGNLSKISKTNNPLRGKELKRIFKNKESRKNFTIKFGSNSDGQCFPKILKKNGITKLDSIKCNNVRKFFADNPSATQCLAGNYATKLGKVLYNNDASMADYQALSNVGVYGEAKSFVGACREKIERYDVEGIYSAINQYDEDQSVFALEKELELGSTNVSR